LRAGGGVGEMLGHAVRETLKPRGIRSMAGAQYLISKLRVVSEKHQAMCHRRPFSLRPPTTNLNYVKIHGYSLVPLHSVHHWINVAIT
jgi:hypothetical protein